MSFWTWFFWILVVGIVLDRVVTYYWDHQTATFAFRSSPRGQSKTLVVYLPGVLAHGVRSSAPVRDLWLEYGDLLMVSYGNNVTGNVATRFNHRAYERAVALQIIKRVADNGYDQIVYVGSSMGGHSAAGIASRVARERHDVTPALITVDVPTSARTLLPVGRLTALLVLTIPFDRLLNHTPIMSAFAQPPKDAEIQTDLDKEAIKREAAICLANWPFSLFRDQTLAMVFRRLSREDYAVFGYRMVYIRCDRKGGPVKQPPAQEEFNRLATGVMPHCVIVDSPHCGYLQLPALWWEAFTEAFAWLRVHKA